MLCGRLLVRLLIHCVRQLLRYLLRIQVLLYLKLGSRLHRYRLHGLRIGALSIRAPVALARNDRVCFHAGTSLSVGAAADLLGIKRNHTFFSVLY